VGIWKRNDQLLGKHWSHRRHQSKIIFKFE
jgi:hypothetical protein